MSRPPEDIPGPVELKVRQESEDKARRWRAEYAALQKSAEEGSQKLWSDICGLIQAEREACAKIADEYARRDRWDEDKGVAAEIAKLIRAKLGDIR